MATKDAEEDPNNETQCRDQWFTWIVHHLHHHASPGPDELYKCDMITLEIVSDKLSTHYAKMSFGRNS